MIKIYIATGPIGAGKTSYIHRLLETNPEVGFIEHDQIIASLPRYVNYPYGAGYPKIEEVMFKRIEELLKGKKSYTLIVDRYTGSSDSRKRLRERLTQLGAHRIYCLLFMTDQETCVRWFNRKVNKFDYNVTDDLLRQDHKKFHRDAECIDLEGFTSVKRIDVNKALIRI